MSILSEKNEKLVSRQYRGLLRDFHKSPPRKELKRIRRALDHVIEKCHDLSERYTGELHVLHVLKVARILAKDMGMGSQAVIGALLIPPFNHKRYERDELGKELGEESLGIFDNLVKITGVDWTRADMQVEAFKKLILTLAGEMQVLLIYLAERLHIMRMLENAEAETQKKVALDTLNLSASLAHRLGLYSVKSEMEDLALKYMEPDSYNAISKKLADTTRSRNRFIRDFTGPIKERLDELGLKYEIKGRLKSVHSIWKKMQAQKVEFEEVYDLFAIRIIADSKPKKERADCWQVYSMVTDLYTPNPKRLRDWISIPKVNGYESLHTTVASPKGRWVEVQIRSRRMDEYAEKGMAAHWMYKGSASDKLMDKWLGRMREVMEQPESDSRELMKDVKENLKSEEIYVFTPRGDLKRLSQGATVLDFAFEIHSDVGAKCMGGRVNGKNASIKQELRNGDMVDINTSKNQKPTRDWLNFVVSSKAKTRIKLSLNEEKLKNAEIGKEILKRRFRNWKIEFNDEHIKKLLKNWGLKYSQDLYYMISEEKIGLMEIKAFISRDEEVAEAPREEKEGKASILVSAPAADMEDVLVIDNKVEGIDYKFASCCKPKPGNRIFGFVTIREGIKVHRMDCPNARQMIKRYPYRVIQTRWTEAASGFRHSFRLRISGRDDMGLVNRVTEIIGADKEINMQSVSFSAKEGTFTGEIGLLVRDRSHLENISKRLLNIKGVEKVSSVSL